MRERKIKLKPYPCICGAGFSSEDEAKAHLDEMWKKGEMNEPNKHMAWKDLNVK